MKELRTSSRSLKLSYVLGTVPDAYINPVWTSYLSQKSHLPLLLTWSQHEPGQRRVGGGWPEGGSCCRLPRKELACSRSRCGSCFCPRLAASQPARSVRQAAVFDWPRRLWPREPDPPHSPGSFPQPFHTHYLVSPEPCERSKYNSYTHFTSGKTCLENQTLCLNGAL